MRKFIGLSLIFFVYAALTVSAQEKHPFSFYDMIEMDRIGSPVVSPDGELIAFTISDYSLEKKTNTDIFLASSDGSNLTRLTNHTASDFNPVFSKDSKFLYFLSTRNGLSQIFRIPLNGGEPVQVSDFPVSVNNMKLSPDGLMFSFSTAVYPDTSDFEKVSQRDKAKADSGCSALVYDELFVRHWDTFEDGKWEHLFIYPVDGSKKPVDIMEGIKGNCPSEPFGDASEYNWSPDSKAIAFTTKIGKDRAWTTNFDVYIYNIETKTTKNITKENTAWDTAPVFSPDNSSLFYLAMNIPGYEADRFRIMKYDLKSKKAENLSENFEVSPGSLIVSECGKTLFFAAGKEAHHRIFSFDIASKNATELVSKHFNRSPVLSGDTIYFAQDSMAKPAELYSYNLKSRKTSKLTSVNDERLSKVVFGDYEEFWFTNRDNIKVHGWIIKPVNFDSTKKYPLAFFIHGGPQGSWEDHFHYRWNMMIPPSEGYVAVAIDFRGSTGYGDEFKEAISKHWGSRPFFDLMDGLDYVIKTYPFIDENNMGALGASYGGYMINWIAGNAPDRFNCLINHDGGFDEKSSYYNTEELWFPEYEFGGTPYENPELYEKFSPSTYVKNWKTPMLVIHGGLDYRVVDTEGLSTFNALQRLGIESRLIYFPDENHWVLKPKNSEFWHKSVIEWLDKYCK